MAQWWCLLLVIVIGIVRTSNSQSTFNDTDLNETVKIPDTIAESDNDQTKFMESIVDQTSDDDGVVFQNETETSTLTTPTTTTSTTTTEESFETEPDYDDEVDEEQQDYGDVVEIENNQDNGPQMVEIEPYGDSQATFEANFLQFMKENPDEIEISIPYSNESVTQSVEALGGIGVDVTVHLLDINPETDYLYIRGGGLEEEEETGPMLTGTLKAPMKFRLIHTKKFTVEFHPENDSQVEESKYRGIVITYSSYGDVIELTTIATTEATVPAEKLEFVIKKIEVESAKQNNETWETIREVLSNSSNLFLEEYNLNYEPARPDRVILIMVQRCPEAWPRSSDCVVVQFGIPLPPKEVLTFGSRRTTTPEPTYELSRDNLDKMWTEFAVKELERTGFPEYIITESGRILAIWITISLCVIAAFMMVLYGIWKIDFMKDYRRMSDSHDDGASISKQPIDPSIDDYTPSPHDGIDDFMRDYAPNDFNKAYKGTPYGLETTKNPFEFQQNISDNFSQTNLNPFETSIVDFNELPDSKLSNYNEGKLRHNTYDELSHSSATNNSQLYVSGSNSRDESIS